MRRTAYKQNGSASLFNNIRFRFKSPEILYIFKTLEKAWSLIFNLHCTVAKHLLNICSKTASYKMSLYKTPRRISNAAMMSTNYDKILA